MKAEIKKPTYCVGCNAILRYPLVALSRFDNRTSICSDCGSWEAVVQFDAQARGKNPREALAAPGKRA
jgi:RNase P subunit RPR2